MPVLSLVALLRSSAARAALDLKSAEDLSASTWQPSCNLPSDLSAPKGVAYSYEIPSISDFLVGNFPIILPRLVWRCASGNRHLGCVGRRLLAIRFGHLRIYGNARLEQRVRWLLHLWRLCAGRLRVRRVFLSPRLTNPRTVATHSFGHVLEGDPSNS